MLAPFRCVPFHPSSTPGGTRPRVYPNAPFHLVLRRGRPPICSPFGGARWLQGVGALAGERAGLRCGTHLPSGHKVIFSSLVDPRCSTHPTADSAFPITGLTLPNADMLRVVADLVRFEARVVALIWRLRPSWLASTSLGQLLTVDFGTPNYEFTVNICTYSIF
jgi:hypothetical protein